MPVLTWSPPSIVNTTLPGDQNNPDVVALPDGGYLVVWMDNGNILGRFYNAGGTPRTGEIVMATGTDPFNNPDVAVHADGTVFLTYNINDAGEDTNVVAAFDANGTLLSSSTSTALATEFDDPDIVVSGDTVFIGLGRTISGTEDAFVLRFGWNGSTLAFEGVNRANNLTAGDQEDVDLAVLADGNIVTVWRDSLAIEFEILTPAGTQVIGADVLVANTGNSFSNPEVLALANGGFVVTYARTNNANFPANLYDVYFRVFGPDGTAHGPEVFVNSSITRLDQFYPAATALNDGGFAVFWFDGNGVDSIRGQLFDALGNPRGGPFLAAQDVVTNFDTFDVDTLTDGRIVLTYEINKPGSASEVVVKILDPRDGLTEGSDNNDTLYGSIAADEIQARDGDDIVDAMRGDDLVFGHGGSDTLIGGEGLDTLIGGDGNDRLRGGTQEDQLDGGDGNDTLYGDSGFDTLNGGDGDDRLEGGEQADNLFGDNGNDLLLGGGGFDRLFGGAGNDTGYGGDGSDALFGMDGNDRLYGQDGNDRFWGGTGNDLLDGGAGDDQLRGGAGFDTLVGSTGNDTLTGNFNADTFVFADFGGGFGQDTITDFDANNDLEKIDLSLVSGITDFTDLVNNRMNQVGAHVVIDDGSGNTITLLNVNLGDLHGVDFLF